MNSSWRRNWGYKLVSVFLAVLLWLLVSNQVRSENAQQVIPLQERGVPANLIVTSKLLSTVSVRLQSVGNVNLTKDMVGYIDLSGAEKGEKTYPVTVPVPPGVRVVSIEPANVSVTLDELKEKTLPVTLEPLGKVAEGYDLGKPVIRPSSVIVRGPAQKLNQLEQVFVEVNLANSPDTIQVSTAVRFKDAGGNPITGPDPTRPIIVSQPQEVNVLIPVVKKDLASKTVPVRATTKGNPANGWAVSQVIVTPTAVKLFGTADKLKGIDSLNAGVIDISGATQDVVVEVKPENLSLPSGVTLEAGAKINILVRLTPALVEKTIKGIPVTVKNLATGQQVDPSSPTVDITVKGSPDAVNGIKISDIVLWVDLTGLGPGQQSVQVFGQLPQGVEALNLPKISVTINQQ